jgi:GNAT superfamily N-acetyltransferase
MAEKLALYPQGCRKLIVGTNMLGYAIAHPWRAGYAPALDSLLGVLPAEPACLHMHDVALLPEARGLGAARAYVDALRRLARDEGIQSLACVSVYGTASLWGALGFRQTASIEGSLATYPAGAMYMTAPA